MPLDILIVDDERDIRELVAGVLSDEGYGCRLAGDSVAALAAVDERRPSLVLLDVWLHGSPMDGLEVLDEIKKREPELPVIIFSGHGNIDTAVSAIGRGAMLDPWIFRKLADVDAGRSPREPYPERSGGPTSSGGRCDSSFEPSLSSRCFPTSVSCSCSLRGTRHGRALAT